MKIEDLKILALIPARGGSKRLPGKNIKELCGKPLIAWTIETALNSKYIEKTVVSTDCDKIAEVSKKYGAEVPFIRPDELASDTASTLDVVFHALTFLKNIQENFTHIILLQPTSPLRTSDDIDNAVELLVSKGANAVYSVCEVDHSPLWSNTLPEDQKFDGFIKREFIGKRSQDLPTYYRLNGAIYLVDVSELLNYKALLEVKSSFAFVMKRQSSIDIDEKLDFLIAESILSDLKSH